MAHLYLAPQDRLAQPAQARHLVARVLPPTPSGPRRWPNPSATRERAAGDGGAARRGEAGARRAHRGVGGGELEAQAWVDGGVPDEGRRVDEAQGAQVVVEGVADEDAAAQRRRHALPHLAEGRRAHQVSRADTAPAGAVVGHGLVGQDVFVQDNAAWDSTIYIRMEPRLNRACGSAWPPSSSRIAQRASRFFRR